MRARFLPLLLALPLLAAGPLDPQARLADDLLVAARSGDATALAAARSALRQVLTPGDDSPRALESDFAWAAFRDGDPLRLPRARFEAGERITADALQTTRLLAAGGVQIAMTGEALIALRKPGEAPFALRHDFTRIPLLTLPVAPGDELAILPLGPNSAGVTAFDPYFPCSWAALDAEPTTTDGRARAMAIHFETDQESGVFRFELQRSVRPDGGWRTIAVVPAIGGGDYHIVDSRPVERGFYRVVPVLASGLRAAPSMVLATARATGH